jgi:hypothetical protein
VTDSRKRESYPQKDTCSGTYHLRRAFLGHEITSRRRDGSSTRGRERNPIARE